MICNVGVMTTLNFLVLFVFFADACSHDNEKDKEDEAVWCCW